MFYGIIPVLGFEGLNYVFCMWTLGGGNVEGEVSAGAMITQQSSAVSALTGHDDDDDDDENAGDGEADIDVHMKMNAEDLHV